MRRGVYICLVLIILMTGLSLVFAQSNSENGSASGGGGGVASSSGGGAGPLHTVNVDVATSTLGGGGAGGGHATVIKPIAVDATTARICVVNSELMKELDHLMILLKEAEESGDKELVEMLYKEIQGVKEKINKDIKQCRIKSLHTAEPMGVSVSAINVGPTYVNKCSVLKDIENKKKHYEKLYLLSEEELSNKGYSSDDRREEIKKILEELEREIEKVRIECENVETTPGSSGGGGGGGSILIPKIGVRILKPIAVSSGKEITNYYKIKVSDIMIKEIETGERITELKELRNEIDKLIEELIKSKDEIRIEEMDELVTEIKIKPGKIEADKVVVNTVNKNIIVKVNKKHLIIKPAKAHVSIEDGKFKIKAPELNVRNNTLRVGDTKIRILISKIVEELKIEPKEIELKEENTKVVYKIRVEENRKLLWVVPVKIENTITVDAGHPEVEVIKEELPWWGFLTVK